jgi:ElaB/YqjD/DUF883 family membrane-anchored ribosome-binding protein
MDERRLESIGEGAQRAARRTASDAQDLAARAQERAQEAAQRAGSYVQERARDANHRLERLTGRPAESWMEDARRFVQDHPMQAVAITVGLGFVLGKILARD